METLKNTQKWAIGLWLTIAGASLCLLYFKPEWFTIYHIAKTLQYFQHELLLVYLGIMILRGFTLLPSTPFVLASTILMPQHPWLLLAISLFGILMSATLLYYFADFLGFGRILEQKYPSQLTQIHQTLDKPYGVLLVFLWAFFPLAPTDVVCYVAGMLRMRFASFISAIFLGELLLCYSCIFLGVTYLGIGT